MTIKELKPELIWGIFDEITNVPPMSRALLKKKERYVNSSSNLQKGTTSRQRPTQ